jgi:protein involved in sex pheromone biosynthesis
VDSQFIWNAILTIGMAIISALIALGAKYLSQIQKTIEDRLDNQDEIIHQLREDYKKDLCGVVTKADNTQEDLSKFKVTVQREFVNRDEYIRTTQSLDAKMDRVLGEIGKIQVNVAKLAAAQEVKTQ